MTTFSRGEYISTTSDEWAIHNPVLSRGDVSIESDTGLVKVGDGLKTYVNLYGMSGLNSLSNLLIVKSVDDLPDPVGDEITLPTGTVLLNGTVDLGDLAVRLSTGTLLRGLGGDNLISSNTNGVIRATNLTAPLVMREFSVIATAGPCLALSANADEQLNMFFMAFLGASVGTVTGFDVQAFKDCYFNTPSGITTAGVTNKVFFSQCVFYGATAGNAAITLDSTLNANRIDMVNNFFKHDAAGIPLKAEVGYNVDYGRVNGSMLQGPTVMLDGISETDINWWFDENDLVANSRATAQSFLTAPATTTITAQSTFTQVEGPFTVTDLTQRFILSGTNELEYVGGDPILITFASNFTVDPSNNNQLAFRATKNGTTLDYSQTIVEAGAGAGAAPRSGSTLAIIDLLPGDRVGMAVSNLSAIADVPWLSATFTITA